MRVGMNEKVKTISVPGIRQFSNWVAQYEDAVNLTIGEPDFATPQAVKEAGIQAIMENKTGYSHNAGLFELRQAVSSFFKEKYLFEYNPENEIMITCGASQALDSALRTILAPGDEVILIAPFYSGYESLVIVNDGIPVLLDTSETNFKPDPKQLENLITEKTKAIIVNYPNNPTGVTLNKADVDDLVDVFERHDLLVISDEIYSENSFIEKHISFASYPELRERLILVHGLSKSHAMTGWRIGFLLADVRLAEEILKVHLNNIICASVPGQYAGIQALTESKEAPKSMTETYLERSHYLKGALEAMGMSIVEPEGAFYIFASIKKFGLDSVTFAEKLIESEHMAVVPGSSFSKYGEGYIRISYASDMKTLQEGMVRLRRFCQKLSSQK